MSFDMECPFGQFGSWLCPLPTCCPPQPTDTGGWGGYVEREAGCHANPVQQQPKHWCVNAVLATDVEHSHHMGCCEGG